MKENKTYIDYATQNGYMVMVAFYFKNFEEEWFINQNLTDYKVRKITIFEKIKNAIIKIIGGELKDKYKRNFIYDISGVLGNK